MIKYSFVGVDIAKDKFDVAIMVNDRYKHEVFSNDEEGHAKFYQWLNTNTHTPWVCMEATGHYSTGLADFLAENKVYVSVANPYQIRHFAKASLARNKNDIVDAKIIAQFAERMQPRLYKPSPKEQKELRALANLINLVKSQLIQLNNQLHSSQGKIAQKALKKMVKQVEKAIAEADMKMAELIESSDVLREKMRLLLSIKGVGKLTAYQVLARMPDVSNFGSAKAYAAYIGITPKQHQSGTFSGRTTISRLGDGELRKALYMAALVAKRHNKGFASFVNRLEANGKAPKVIICAAMRKLAHVIFGVLKNKTLFDDKIACA